LNDWSRAGWLKAHEPSAEEIGDLLALTARDLDDCKVEALSADWRFGIAYNAALQAATAALAAAGYRASREAHHYRVIQSLTFTVGLPSNQIRQLDRFRKKRNMGGYERAGVVSDQEVAEMVQLAEELARAVREWLEDHHLELL